MVGRSRIGSSSFGTALAAGSMRVPKPATGMTAFFTLMSSRSTSSENRSSSFRGQDQRLRRQELAPFGADSNEADGDQGVDRISKLRLGDLIGASGVQRGQHRRHVFLAGFFENPDDLALQRRQLQVVGAAAAHRVGSCAFYSSKMIGLTIVHRSAAIASLS